MKLEKGEIERIVMDVTREKFSMTGAEYDNGAKSKTWQELGADSLDEVELLMMFEEETGYEFEDEDAEKIRTPQQAIDYLLENYS